MYILPQNFIIAQKPPKAQQARGENFYNCPQFAHCVQWNILKFPHFVPQSYLSAECWVHMPLNVKQDQRSIDVIVIRLQWLLMTLLLQNVKQKSNMNEIMDIYLNVQIFKCLDIYKYPDIKMSRYLNVLIFKSPMSRYLNVQIFKCHNIKMSRYLNVTI